MKIFFPVLIAVTLLAGCLKKDQTCGYTEYNLIAPPVQVQQLNDSLTKYGITATTLHPSGFYYKINTPGSGPSVANLCSNITVMYKGKFFDGKGFDSTKAGQAVDFQLGEVIAGWQKAIPLVSKGGDIDMYIPPYLAYGTTPRNDNSGNVIIPASSYLVFKVHIIDIQ
ncbi:MAG: FKBP-type peptidyl-prolyl cis-trans isomerase [Ginsengibacter sp.]